MVTLESSVGTASFLVAETVPETPGTVPLSKFYGNSVYIPIGCLLSVSLFFSTMNMVPNALLMKEKKFVRIGLRMITKIGRAHV